MGRRIPSDMNPLIHPAFSLPLLTASIAATIVIIAAICGARSRKTSPPSQKTAKKSENSTMATKTTPIPLPTTTKVPLEKSTEKTSTPQVQEQQQPPSNPKSKDSLSQKHMTNSTSKRKLMVSLSMKMAGGAVAARYRARKEEEQEQKLKRLKPEDSIWKKTIILGERCRVPNEVDAIIYDDRGNRIAAYPTRTPRSLPVSRSNSFIDRDTVS